MFAKSKQNRRVLNLVCPLAIALGIALASSPAPCQQAKTRKPESTPVGAEWLRVRLDAYDVDKSKAAPAERRTALKFDGTAKVEVDPKKHCLYIGIPPYEGCENGTLRIDLDKGETYTVRCSGEAFMSTETGEFADPYPGIFFAYQTDEQDCHKICNTILKPGDAITFTTPTCIGEDEDVFAIAFFMQAWKHAYWPDQRGSYTLTFTRTAGN